MCELLICRDDCAIQEAGKIWAEATARRDGDELEESDFRISEQLIKQVLVASPQSFLLLLKQDNSVVGFLVVQPLVEDGNGKSCEIKYLGVYPQYWGGGYAHRLLQKMAGVAREVGFETALLWVCEDNLRANQVYEQMGWVRSEKTRTHLHTGRIENQYVLSLG